jgi:hypothetical protein
MYQDTPIIARYTFRLDRADEFSYEGHQIIEMAFDEVKEAYEFAVEFRDALLDVTVLTADGDVITLSDYTTC